MLLDLLGELTDLDLSFFHVTDALADILEALIGLFNNVCCIDEFEIVVVCLSLECIELVHALPEELLWLEVFDQLLDVTVIRFRKVHELFTLVEEGSFRVELSKLFNDVLRLIEGFLVVIKLGELVCELVDDVLNVIYVFNKLVLLGELLRLE